MAERLVELHDPTPAPQTRLRVVAEASNFQGAAGEFLAKMLRAIGYVLIGSPELSDPRAPGAAVLLVLGPAALAAVKPESMFNMVRGKWVKVGDLQAMVTYDPVYLEVSVAYKRMAWEDLQKIPEKFALSIPALPKR
jgi:uracil-DNA glycosylase